MLDLILLLITCFVILLLFLPFLAICILVVVSLFGHSKQEPYIQTNNAKNNPTEDLTEDSKEDSEADGLLLFDDPLFPPEEDGE
jgi:hypothetical protein